MPENVLFIFSTLPDSENEQFGYLPKLRSMFENKGTCFLEIQEIGEKDLHKTLERLSEELEIEFSEDMLTPGRTNSSEVGQNKEGGIATVSLEKWKSQLSSSKVGVIEWICRRELRNYNYPASKNFNPATEQGSDFDSSHLFPAL